MKAKILIAPACAIVLIGLSAPAFADALGEKIAAKLCPGKTTSYTLSQAEEAVWKEAHTGSYAGSAPGTVHTFSKSAGTDSGKCIWRSPLPPEIASARVTKSGSTLSRTGYAQGAMIE